MTMYMQGLGVDENKRQAFHYMKKAAELKLTQAYTNLGNMYENGLGTAQSYKKAFIGIL